MPLQFSSAREYRQPRETSMPPGFRKGSASAPAPGAHPRVVIHPSAAAGRARASRARAERDEARTGLMAGSRTRGEGGMQRGGKSRSGHMTEVRMENPSD